MEKKKIPHNLSIWEETQPPWISTKYRYIFTAAAQRRHLRPSTLFISYFVHSYLTQGMYGTSGMLYLQWRVGWRGCVGGCQELASRARWFKMAGRS